MLCPNSFPVYLSSSCSHLISEAFIPLFSVNSLIVPHYHGHGCYIKMRFWLRLWCLTRRVCNQLLWLMKSSTRHLGDYFPLKAPLFRDNRLKADLIDIFYCSRNHWIKIWAHFHNGFIMNFARSEILENFHLSQDRMIVCPNAFITAAVTHSFYEWSILRLVESENFK